MALFNYTAKEITLKVVYYGPGLSGKTTNLQWLHTNLDKAKRSKLLSVATEPDRTLFFDFLPMDVAMIGGFKVKFQLYTVPGQVRYDATRKLVLKGADAVVFVADSQRAMRDSNLVSYENMKENLVGNNLDPANILFVLQYNKRDLPDIMSVAEMDADLNERKVRTLEACAVKGEGVRETFDEIMNLLIEEAHRRQKLYEEGQAPGTGRPLDTKVGPARMNVRPAVQAPGRTSGARSDSMASLWEDVKSGRERPQPVRTVAPPRSNGKEDLSNLVDRLSRLFDTRSETETEILALLREIRNRLG